MSAREGSRPRIRRALLGFVALAVVVGAFIRGPDTVRWFRYSEFGDFRFGEENESRLRYGVSRWGDHQVSIEVEGGVGHFRTGGGLPMLTTISDDRRTYLFWFPGNTGAPDIVCEGPATDEQIHAVVEDRRARYPDLRWQSPKDDAE